MDVITIGSATKDAYFRSKYDIINSKKIRTGVGLCVPFGSKIELDEVMFETGGGATNTAVGFSRMGLKTACICKIGEDSPGKHVLYDLKDEKVNTTFTIKVKTKKHQCKTGYSAILEHNNGERTILMDRGLNSSISIKDIKLSKLNTKWLYLAPLSGDSEKIIEPLIKYAKKKKIKVAINPSGHWLKKRRSILKLADVVIMNQEEASIYTNTNYNQTKKIFEKLCKLPGIVVMTRGNKGCFVCDHDQVFQEEIFQSPVTDTLGAGDSFGCGFVSGLIKGLNIPDCIELGSLNATSVLQHVGAKKGLLKYSQVKKFKRSL